MNCDDIYSRPDYRLYLQRDHQAHPQTNSLYTALEVQHLPMKTCIKLEADKSYGLDEEKVRA